jgi:Flp pilus assembly pilin Flp
VLRKHKRPNHLSIMRPIFTPMRGRRAVRGQTLVEYALILAIISILAIAMMLQLTGNVRAIYSNIDSQVSRSNTGS